MFTGHMALEILKLSVTTWAYALADSFLCLCQHSLNRRRPPPFMLSSLAGIGGTAISPIKITL
jgi:hypothetical protein